MAIETPEKKTVLINSVAELNNLVDYKRGYKPNSKERPAFVYKAIEKGVMTDGQFLLEDKEATEKVVGKYIAKEQEEAIKRIVGYGQFSREEATERIKASFAELAKEGTYPDYKRIYPKRVGKEAKLVGISKNGGYAGGPKIVAYLSDGKHIAGVNAEKLAFILHYLPGAKMAFASKDPTTSPITFITPKGKRGLLMTLWQQKQEVPPTIKDATIRVEGQPGVNVSKTKARKEPWQMTVDDYNEHEHPSNKKPIEEIRRELITEMERRRKEEPDHLPHELRQNFRPEKYFSRWRDDELRDWHSSIVAGEQSHRAIVEKALRAGKPVPDDVLEHYPDLQKTKASKPHKEITALKPKPRMGVPGRFKKPRTKQSNRAIAIDRALLAKQVVQVDDPRWLRHPNRFDVRGIDTPSSGRITSRTGFTDRGKTRMSRKHHRGWKRVKYA